MLNEPSQNFIFSVSEPLAVRSKMCELLMKFVLKLSTTGDNSEHLDRMSGTSF